MASDAAVLRAAAAVCEVQAKTRPHLMGLANRLLALATQITPTTDQEDTDAQPL